MMNEEAGLRERYLRLRYPIARDCALYKTAIGNL